MECSTTLTLEACWHTGASHTLTCACDLKVESSVSKVLEDMKKKYDAANKQSAQAQSQQNKSNSDLDMIEQVQKAKLDEIKKLCK